MSTQDIGELLNSVNDLTQTVAGKMGDIDQRMESAEDEFDEWRQQKDVIGDPSGCGTLRMNIFQGLVGRTRGEAFAFGGFTATNLGTDGNVYMHFKTPLNVNNNNEMFWFNIRGYSFGSSKILDETIVGYCYANKRELLSKSSFGNLMPDSYFDTAGNIIIRILLPSVYYTTVRIDSMKVGNGRLFSVGDLESRLSLEETVEF